MKNNMFIIIGAQRSGTTYLYKILYEHPEIYMAKPIKPEPKFFLIDEEYERGLNYYQNKYFNHGKDEKNFGEKSTCYYESEKAAQRIKKNYPFSKIIIILRNPSDRAISNYFFSRDNGIETRTIKEVFIDKKPEAKKDIKTSVSPFDYLGRSDYKTHIQKYLKYFHKEHFKVIIMEEFVGNIEQIKELYRFLDVNPDFLPPSLKEKINPSEKSETDTDEQILKSLHKYFAPLITELESYLCIDLTCWKI